VWDAIHTKADRVWGLITGTVRSAFTNIKNFANDILGAINWVITKLNSLAHTSIGTLPLFGGGGSSDNKGTGGPAPGGAARTSSIPSAGGLGLMDNGGTGAATHGGGRGGLGDDVGGWLGELWNKYGITSRLPKPIGGLFGNATGALYNMAKDAILAILKKYGGGPGQQIIDWAKTQLGKPYVWGATGPDAYDCSGLIYRGYLTNGRSIPRSDMWNAGRQVSNGSVRPADVGFFSPNVVQDGRLVKYGHVKMYAGNGQSIESTSGGVQMGAWGGASEIRTYLGLGGITRGISIAGEAGPEAVIPLTNARRGAAVMKEAGLIPSGGGGDTFIVHIGTVVATNAGQAQAAANDIIRRLATAKRNTALGTA
jgi:hypothetical protein